MGHIYQSLVNSTYVYISSPRQNIICNHDIPYITMSQNENNNAHSFCILINSFHSINRISCISHVFSSFNLSGSSWKYISICLKCQKVFLCWERERELNWCAIAWQWTIFLELCTLTLAGSPYHWINSSYSSKMPASNVCEKR